MASILRVSFLNERKVVQQSDALETQFQNRLRSGRIFYSAEISEAGLVFGAGTCLARLARDFCGAPYLALAEDRERIDALLLIAGHRPVSADALRNIEAASDHWRGGDKALANIRLTQAGLPRLANAHDAYRLFLAEELLDQGMPHVS